MNDNTSKILGLALAGAGGVALGATLGILASKSNRKKKRKSAKRKAKNRKKRNRSSSKKRRYPYTAGKRKDTSRRRIRFTKNGQPYIIVKGGKAKFIKRSSVRNSRKRQGGKY